MADDRPIFNGVFTLGDLQRLLGAMSAPTTQCGVRRCRRQGGCLAVNPRTGEPVCTPWIATGEGADRLDTFLVANLWLIESVEVGIPQPFGEWPENTIGPRLAACLRLPTVLDAGPELSRLRRWWRDCRKAAIAAGWSIPRRSSASPFRRPPGAAKTTSAGRRSGRPATSRNGTTGPGDGRKCRSNP